MNVIITLPRTSHKVFRNLKTHHNLVTAIHYEENVIKCHLFCVPGHYLLYFLIVVIIVLNDVTKTN